MNILPKNIFYQCAFNVRKLIVLRRPKDMADPVLHRTIMICLFDLTSFLKKNRFALGLTLDDFHCSLTTMARSSVKFDKMTAKFVALDTTFSIFVCTKIANTSFKRELLYAQKHNQLTYITLWGIQLSKIFFQRNLLNFGALQHLHLMLRLSTERSNCHFN